MATHNTLDATTEERRHPTEPENLPCPRCDSTNTKFCYYNNYNLSQPRYFCKSCRRYWTRGGTLRNIPVGGGTRKNSKRSRSSSSSSSFAAVGSTVTPPPPAMFEIQKVGASATADEAISKWQDDLELNMNQGSFTSLLTTNNTNSNASGCGLGLGYGIGIGIGIGTSSYDELGFGLGAPMTVGDEAHGHGQQIVGVVQNNTWQFGGESMDGAGCFGWPDLAI